MSATLIRSALETSLAALSPAIATAYENVDYTPVQGTPYQRVNVLFATPQSLEMSQKLHREQGFMQVTLCYPKHGGTAAATARAEAIRAAFPAASEHVSGSVTVTIDGLPSIDPAPAEDDRFNIIVRVRFYAHVLRS